MNLICYAIGCKPESGCHRCGSSLYDWEFRDGGLMHPLRRIWWRVRARVRGLIRGKTCAECKRKISRLHSTDFCSEECRDNYLPF